jgi:ABC-2 type transport system permease protein
MRISWSRAASVARREYLALVRRKAFLFTALGTPAYFAFVMWMSIKPQISQREEALRNLRVLAVVDSSGLYVGADRSISTTFSAELNPFSTSTAPAPEQRFSTQVRVFPDLPTADDSLRAGAVSQVLVIPPNFLETGGLKRYARSSNLFSSAEDRPLTRWLVRSLLLRRGVDSVTIERVARPLAKMDLYTLNKQGRYEIKDDRRELFDFFLPFSFGMLLGLCIVIGGQYLLQGVSEEKESRILESLLCTVSAEELLAGKLIGLGGGGLTLVALWSAAGAFFAGPAAAIAHLSVPPFLLVAMIAYLLLGYLFYGSLMTGIGAITNNMREAQQFAFMFTFANWAPFIMLTSIIGKPDGRLAVGLSLFPPTAPVTMMMRLSASGSSVPGWQVALSMALLALTAVVTLVAAARVFRVGLLMYGKTPTLPEILRWARSG